MLRKDWIDASRSCGLLKQPDNHKMPSPLTVIWGNPVIITGWDEGVSYDRLFPSRGNPSEAVIGGIPLFMHTIFVIVGL